MTALWDLDRKPRILVVENSVDVGNMLHVYLTGLGADVTVRDRGGEGLALFSTGVFDLVILDVLLPDTNGFEVIRSIRGSGSRVPVFFVTQHPDVNQGLELGADDYILLPFDAEEFAFRVRVGLRHRMKDLRST